MSTTLKISRRSFVRGAGGAAVAITAPCFIPRHVLGAPGKPGANDRVGVGYISVGRRAQQVMGLPPEGRIVAVCDINAPRAKAVAAQRKCRAYTDHRAMLEAADIDAVVVATPDHWHTLPSVHACQAGQSKSGQKDRP